MKVLNYVQGTPQWLEARAKYYTASEASVMMGAFPGVTRNDLLRAKYNGGEKEVSTFVQEKIFDRGHEVEAETRPVIEAELGEDLYPCMVVDDDGFLSASLDGMTMNRKTLWECKQWSESKATHIREAGTVPPVDFWQVQQQLLVTGAERLLYTVGDQSDPETAARVWVEPVEEAFVRLRDGWNQFGEDLADYTPPADAPEAVGHTMESLPALRVEVTGQVTASNLAAYKEHALAVFESINTELSTDQDFADAEATVKWCKDVEDRLEGAKQNALSQTASIDELFRTIDDLKESARQKRLELNKLVTARKAAVRDEIRSSADRALAEHMQGLEQRLEDRVRLPKPEADFAAAMKGKRTIASLRDAVDQVLANAKIEANATADQVQRNLKVFDELAKSYYTLFPHINELVLKAADDFEATVKLRIGEHEAAQDAQRAQEAEAKSHGQHVPEDKPAPTEQVFEGARTPNGRPARQWRLVATFEVNAPHVMEAGDVEDKLWAALSKFDTLVSITAEEASETPESATDAQEAADGRAPDLSELPRRLKEAYRAVCEYMAKARVAA